MILDPLIHRENILDEHELDASSLQFGVARAPPKLPAEDACIEELQNLDMKVSQSILMSSAVF